MDAMKIPQIVTLKEAAEITGLAYGLLRNKALNGEIVAFRAGRKILINLDKLIEHLNSGIIQTDQTENRTAPALIVSETLNYKPRKGITRIF